MGRIEYWLLGAVGALIGFIAFAAARPSHTYTQALSVASSTRARSADSTATGTAAAAMESLPRMTSGDVNGTLRRSSAPPPMRDLADVRRRLTEQAPGTYILDMLSAQDSVLFRWPERIQDRVRVWVQDDPHIPDWWLGYVSTARDVFAEWETVGLPLRFAQVPDSASADITIRWIDRFPPNMRGHIGSTRRTSDQYAWIVRADILVALHDAEGHTFGPNELTAILRHEVGHALGLGHSRDRATIMFPEETRLEIAYGDRETLHLLYSLPPGSVK
jgi:predicted Zn-dependent protease